MEHLTAIIIDDEEESRNGLARIVPWDRLGVTLLLEASNGKQGREMIGQYRPDLILTDVVMPFLNGIELMQHLQTDKNPGKTIIISGYSDFHYAREALRLGAYDYIVKPFRTEEILKIVSQCVEDIKLERLSALQKEEDREKFKESLRMLQEKTVHALLAQVSKEQERNFTRIRQVQLNWMLQYPLTVAVMEIDNLPSLYRNQREKELLLFAIGNVTNDTVNRRLPYFLVQSQADKWVLILASSDRTTVKNLLDTLIRNVGANVKLAVSVGVSRPTEMAELPTAYASAIETLEFKAVLGGNQVLFCEEVVLHPPVPPLSESQIEHSLVSIISAGVNDKEREIEQKLLDMLQSWPERRKEDVQHRLFNWLLKLERQLQAANPQLKIVSGDTIHKWKEFQRFDTLDGIVSFALSALLDMSRQIRDSQNHHLGHTAGNALKIIAEEFASDLTLTALAERVFLSTVWLGHLLKEKTGKTFLELVTERRIQEAKKLLTEVSYKTYEVAELVGYQDTDHFSKVFKKHTGMTPSEYRNSLF